MAELEFSSSAFFFASLFYYENTKSTVNTNYPKYVVTMDSSVTENGEGIEIIHIKGFLVKNQKNRLNKNKIH